MSETLNGIATKMVAPGKGILAADESTATITKRLATISVESTEDTRRDYRELMFRAKDAMESCISGVILYDETLRQKAADGTPLSTLIQDTGAVPGIKVDKGAKALALSPGETVTEGLDGLRERLQEYHGLGARFAKWRAVISIADGLPTENCIQANAAGLARYAALCQENGLVPIVEPEVLMDGAGASHDLATSATVTERVLRIQFEHLALAGVQLDGIVLKPSMIIPGKESPVKASVAEVAEATIKVLKASVPEAVAGIAFLSGGQPDTLATEHLSLINAIGGLPWPVTFSYGRALQAATLQAWGGKPENVGAAQRALTHRARMNSLAAQGKWSADMEAAAA
ncbi:MAG: class I fructose-bisphosphate aldolase [Alphaproteobacteria bacterium]